MDVDLGSLVETLEALQGARLHVTIAVDVDGALEPFVTRQDFELPSPSAAWGAAIPMSWPLKARRLAVTVVEGRTGTQGTATIDLSS